LHTRSYTMVPVQQETIRQRRSSPLNRAHLSKGSTANFPQRRGSRTRQGNSGRHELLPRNSANHDRGHNPRSNAVVERFMQHLTTCLTKCDDSQYSNMRDYLPAIAFAHNTAFNFCPQHGLRARTITAARGNPRLQITAEGGMDIDDAVTNWEKSIFPKVCKLAERLASEAQRHSQWLSG
jgi:hypothetical protein